MTTAAFGFDSVGFSMNTSRDAYLKELEQKTSTGAASGVGRSKSKKKTNKNSKKPTLSQKEAAKLREGLNGYQPVQRGNGMPSEGSLQSYNQRMSSYADINSLERKTAEQKALADKALANARRAEQGARFQGVTSEQIDERLGINNKRPLSGAARASYEAKYASDMEKALAEREAQQGAKGLPKKAKGAGKFLKFFKSGKGKAALITGAVALIGSVIGISCSSKKDNKNTITPPVAEPEDKAQSAEEKVSKPEEVATVPETTPAIMKDEEKTNEYTVKKGDNVWNIAKAQLIERNIEDKNYMPTNKEILKEVHKIMKVNGLKFEEDNYHVMIKPNDKLKLAA